MREHISMIPVKDSNLPKLLGVDYSRLVKLKTFLRTLLSYDYTILDSAKFTDWGIHEFFTSVRVSEALFPIHVEASEVEFVKPLGLGFADGAFNASIKPANP